MVGGSDRKQGGAYITTGDHDAVSLGKNLGKVVEALSVFNLGDDLDVSSFFAQDCSDVLDVLGLPDESYKDL